MTPHSSHRGSRTDERFELLFTDNLNAYLQGKPCQEPGDAWVILGIRFPAVGRVHAYNSPVARLIDEQKKVHGSETKVIPL